LQSASKEQAAAALPVVAAAVKAVVAAASEKGPSPITTSTSTPPPSGKDEEKDLTKKEVARRTASVAEACKVRLHSTRVSASSSSPTPRTPGRQRHRAAGQASGGGAEQHQQGLQVDRPRRGGARRKGGEKQTFFPCSLDMLNTLVCFSKVVQTPALMANVNNFCK
jgi:hypothetical protein